MIIKTVKTAQLNEEERIKLRSARDVLVALNDALSDDNIEDLVHGLELILYSYVWTVEEIEEDE